MRGIEASGQPVDETQRTIALRGIIPLDLLGRLDDLEDNLVSFDSKIRWVERQVEKAHVKRLTDLREKDRGGCQRVRARPGVGVSRCPCR